MSCESQLRSDLGAASNALMVALAAAATAAERDAAVKRHAASVAEAHKRYQECMGERTQPETEP